MLHYMLIFLFLTISTLSQYCDGLYTKFAKRALQKFHEKPRIQKLSGFFLNQDSYSDDPDTSLIDLLTAVASNYLSDCSTAIFYDNYTETQDRGFLTNFFQHYPLAHVHGSIPEDHHIEDSVDQSADKCVHYILFIKDVMRCQDIVSRRSEKVVVVAKSSQWRVQEYLSSEHSQEIANLLIIVKSDKFLQKKKETPYILYTHKLFVDALGSSQPVVLTSWSGANFSRNAILFNTKLKHGFAGHRFIIAAAHQPPYVIKLGRNKRDEIEYDGVEVKLVEILSQMYNFSTDYKESADIKTLGPSEAVIKALQDGNINLGIGGLYITEDRYTAGIFHWHSEDCAAFISLASTALPRYRAIMGPFNWTVWLALIMVYLGAILLFSYSDKSTLKHLIKNPEEIENMFWYVFGTFTNCFTFSDKKSWTKAEKNTTKLLVGIYWIFTIIITACYTGSIIAFVTLPVFPAVIDTVEQLLGGRYEIGMLDRGGWNHWFRNISDEASRKLLGKVDYVPDVESGLKNVTKAFFWSYAFLGSKEELTYVANSKIGGFKSVSEDRALTLDDTQGMFLLLAFGYVAGGAVLISEIFGGCLNLCKKLKTNSRRSSSNVTISSNPRFHERQTNRERHRSVSFTQQQPSQDRSFSLFSDEIEPLGQNPEEAFGENLIHSMKSMRSESLVDYNGKIDEIFDDALENEDCISTEGSEFKEKNIHKTTEN
ncbi:unnamed protein product [Ceutorhynchus assimilis]|uniref:Ionotropic glutamate receptor C-terminal domain-containing protein n=1 Tax=Ceutorhynchus assimilis TaxID=467358 RepID=A0A9N9MBT1_9CUCU|nr:unnamed protein product [Ceutorhynchus assimilis]